MTNRNKSTSTLRLKQDYLRLKRDPVPYITAEPLPQNILEWHYVVKGPEESPYYGGYYHGISEHVNVNVNGRHYCQGNVVYFQERWYFHVNFRSNLLQFIC